MSEPENESTVTPHEQWRAESIANAEPDQPESEAPAEVATVPQPEAPASE